MTATIASFDASDSVAAVVAIDGLTIDANDRIITWTVGTKTYVVRIPIA